MWMELQGKKATHDFLSLYTKDSSFPLQDSKPPSQGFFLKTHDFLQTLEKAEEPEAARRGGPTAEPAGAASGVHVLPGGIGTYSIGQLAGNCSAAVVKPEVFTCVRGSGLAGKPEPDRGSVRYGDGPYASAAFAVWDASSAPAKGSAAKAQLPSPFAARATASFGSFSSRKHPAAHDRKRIMEPESRFSMGFDEDEEDDEFGRREGTSRKVQLTVKVEGKGANDQKATTPRSKHSATEQRRRSKINERFQILRELIPHSDQKRDKASFLLEVIEYIRFLQEKVQKYESLYPGWIDENTKLMPLSNNQQIPGDGTVDTSQVIKNGHAAGFIHLAVDNRVQAAPGMLSAAQNPIKSEVGSGVLYKPVENLVGFTSKASSTQVPSQPTYAFVERGAGAAQPQQRLISDIDNMAVQSQSQWLRPSGPAGVNSDMLSEQEELTTDEGTTNLSTAFSQNILNTLNQAFESSGVDLSQANISVQINLRKRVTRRATTTTMSTAKGLDDPLSGHRPVIGHSKGGSNGEESEQATKRRKSDDS